MFVSILVAIVAFLFVAIIVTAPHEAGHAIVARLCGVRVAEFAVGFGPALFARKIGATKFALRMLPLGGFVRLDDASVVAKGPLRRMCFTVAGPLASIVFGGVMFAVVHIIGTPALTTTIGAIVEGSPAARMGLQPGDEIVAVNGHDVEYWDDVRGRINDAAAAHTPCAIAVRRDGTRINVLLIPEKREGEDVLGDKTLRYVIGVAPTREAKTRRRGPFEALGAAYQEAKESVGLIGRVLKKLMTGAIAPSKAMGGPIALAQISGQAAEMGLVTFLRFIGIISIMLGMMNLLPLPIMDGGQAVMAGVECVRGKPLGPTAEQVMNYVGLAMIGALFAYVMYLDIWKLATGQSLVGK